MKQHTHLRYIFVTILFVLLSTSCVSYIVKTDDLRYFPKSPDYQLKAVFKETDNIRFDGIYIYKTQSPDMKTDLYWFYRFWPSGHVCRHRNALEHIPTVKDVERFHAIDMGYFNVEGDSLSIELFLSVRSGKYFMEEGEIVSPNNIQIMTQKQRGAWGGATRVNMEYEFVEIKGLERIPDW